MRLRLLLSRHTARCVCAVPLRHNENGTFLAGQKAGCVSHQVGAGLMTAGRCASPLVRNTFRCTRCMAGYKPARKAGCENGTGPSKGGS